MRSSDPAAHRWFRSVRLRFVAIFACSAALVIGLVLGIVYRVEALDAHTHICTLVDHVAHQENFYDYHIQQLAQTLLISWIVFSIGAAVVGFFIAPFIMRAAETAMDNLSRTSDAIAHDLRAPLTRLRVRSEMEAAKEGATAEFAIAVANDVQDLLSLVNTLLSIAHLERDEKTLPREAVDLGEIVREAVDVFEPLAESRGIRLIVNPPTEPLVLQAVRVQLGQVVANLLGNAIKHTPSGGWVSLRLIPARTSVELVVSDNGEGIPAEELPHVFEKFYRGKSNAESGNGLGLALVRAIVASLDGTIDVQSLLGHGSVFTVRLPRQGRD